jgi:uncharacterized protein (TIGR02145 family)
LEDVSVIDHIERPSELTSTCGANICDAEGQMIRIAVFLLGLAVAAAPLAAQPKPSGPTLSSKRMADGKQWTTQNLNVRTAQSYCYEDAERNCREYGRLYTWESAQRGCQSLGDGWRLPTDDEWRELAKHYGGLLEDSAEGAKATYRALVIGGTSGFNAVFAGSRGPDGAYERMTAHGFYWTASGTGSTSAAFYNFGKGGQALSRHAQGQRQMAVSVRCIRR